MEETVDKYFPSRYLKAEDVSEETKVTIDKVVEEEVNKEKKLVVYFVELDKGCVMNKTNAYTIAKITDSKLFSEWSGATVVMFKTPVPYKGDVVDAIRFKAPL